MGEGKLQEGRVSTGSHPADGRRQQQGKIQIASPKRKFAVLLVGGAHPGAYHSPESCQNLIACVATLPSPPQPFYLKPQRQDDEKLEVWVTWVCSFARAVLGPHVTMSPCPNSATSLPPHNYQSGSGAVHLPLVELIFYHCCPNHLLCIWCNFSINIPWGFVAFRVCCSPSHSHTQCPWAV